MTIKFGSYFLETLALIGSAAILLLLSVGVFGTIGEWTKLALVIPFLTLVFTAAIRASRRRRAQLHAVKQARDSSLKHLWEERHHREW